MRADGVVQCWGQNDDGEAPATLVAASGTFTHVAAGNDFTCATRSTGFVTCVGALAGIGVPVPGSPATFSLANVGAGLQLTWSDVATETSFEVQRRNTRPDGTWNAYRSLRTAGRNVVSLVDSTVVAGPQYQYRVRACAVGGCSEYRQSGQRYGIEPLPAPPARPTAVPVKGGTVDVAWRDSTGTETSYELQRRLDDTTSAWAPLASVAGTVRTYRDTTGVRAARYVFRVRACNSSGCSGYSETAPVVAETAGTRPATVTASPQPVHQIQVGWSASFNATTYGIQRRRLVSGTWGAWTTRSTVAASGGPGSWTDTAVIAGATYQYRVRGCTTLGCSAYTGSAQVIAP